MGGMILRDSFNVIFLLKNLFGFMCLHQGKQIQETPI